MSLSESPFDDRMTISDGEGEDLSSSNAGSVPPFLVGILANDEVGSNMLPLTGGNSANDGDLLGDDVVMTLGEGSKAPDGVTDAHDEGDGEADGATIDSGAVGTDVDKPADVDEAGSVSLDEERPDVPPLPDPAEGSVDGMGDAPEQALPDESAGKLTGDAVGDDDGRSLPGEDPIPDSDVDRDDAAEAGDAMGDEAPDADGDDRKPISIGATSVDDDFDEHDVGGDGPDGHGDEPDADQDDDLGDVPNDDLGTSLGDALGDDEDGLGEVAAETEDHEPSSRDDEEMPVGPLGDESPDGDAPDADGHPVDGIMPLDDEKLPQDGRLPEDHDDGPVVTADMGIPSTGNETASTTGADGMEGDGETGVASYGGGSHDDEDTPAEEAASETQGTSVSTVAVDNRNDLGDGDDKDEELISVLPDDEEVRADAVNPDGIVNEDGGVTTVTIPEESHPTPIPVDSALPTVDVAPDDEDDDWGDDLTDEGTENPSVDPVSADDGNDGPFPLNSAVPPISALDIADADADAVGRKRRKRHMRRRILPYAACVVAGLVGGILVAPHVVTLLQGADAPVTIEMGHAMGVQTVSEDRLGQVVATWSRNGETHEMTAKEAIELTGSLESMRLADGSYALPTADDVLDAVRDMVIREEAGSRGLSATDDDVTAYLHDAYGVGDVATLAAQVGMNEAEVSRQLRDHVTAEMLRRDVVGVEQGAIPVEPAMPAEGEEGDRKDIYGAYIMGLAGDEWQDGWVDGDSAMAVALAPFGDFDGSNATYEMALAAYDVARTRWTVRASAIRDGWESWLDQALCDVDVHIRLATIG